MIGRVVSHYRILSTLGSGGMGVVYLAEDARLGRQVALKFLPASWSQEPKSLERFRVEARAASSLSHPAICAIYDIGQDGDTPFIVMEALKGETLRERISKGPLKVADVIDISIQLADALEAAHTQGIVHRDIKPANIFLGDRNRVKVLDFGLAKLTSAASSLSSGADTTTPAPRQGDSNQMTQPGTALGTVSYMSPEQARGEVIDSRTDLFSLGAVMYEMVTGSQAFGGTTTAVAFDAILNRSPRPITHLNPLVPPRLEALIATALEKDRDLRYQHASDIQAELRRMRRDLESGSLAGSQSMVAPSRDSNPSHSLPASIPPPTPKAWLEQLPVVVGCLAIVIAVGLLWRTQNATQEDPVATTATVEEPAPTPPPVTTPPPAAPRVLDPPPVVAPRTQSQPAPQVRPQQGQRSNQALPSQPNGRSAPGPAGATSTPAPVNPTQPNGGGRTSTPQPPVDPLPNPSATPPPGAEEPKPQPLPTAPPAAATVAPPPAPVPAPAPAVPPTSAPATAPAPRATAPETARAPAVAAVETDDAAIRRIIRTFEQAIETEDIALYRSVRPGLTSAAEAVVRNSFKQVDSQEIDIRIESIRIDGRNATARLARRDTLVTAGRRQVQNSIQTMRFQKTDGGWIIAE
jgi:serine/threonine protein kinase